MLSLLATAMGSSPTKAWDNDPKGIKVFILAGQSNMVGNGQSEDGGNPQWVKGSQEPKEVKAGLGSLLHLSGVASRMVTF